MAEVKRKRWIYDERYGTIGSIFDEDGAQVAQAMQLIPVRGPDDLEPRRANSRLIAAAPELLAALKETICHSCLNRIGFTGDHVRDPAIPERYDWRKCAACVLPRAAIAKADVCR